MTAPDYWNYEPPTTSAAPISVNLADDEDVEWTWIYQGNGNGMVTGYTIVKKPKHQ